MNDRSDILCRPGRSVPMQTFAKEGSRCVAMKAKIAGREMVEIGLCVFETPTKALPREGARSAATYFGGGGGAPFTCPWRCGKQNGCEGVKGGGFVSLALLSFAFNFAVALSALRPRSAYHILLAQPSFLRGKKSART